MIFQLVIYFDICFFFSPIMSWCLKTRGAGNPLWGNYLILIWSLGILVNILSWFMIAPANFLFLNIVLWLVCSNYLFLFFFSQFILSWCIKSWLLLKWNSCWLCAGGRSFYTCAVVNGYSCFWFHGRSVMILLVTKWDDCVWKLTIVCWSPLTSVTICMQSQICAIGSKIRLERYMNESIWEKSIL